MNRDKILKWAKIQKELRAIKAQELNLRNEILKDILPSNTIGTYRHDDEGLHLKAAIRINYTIDNVEYMIRQDDFTDEERSCVDWVAKLNATKYKKLPQNNALSAIVTATPGQPSLTLESTDDEDN